jgi:hypothetical protein
LRSIVIGGRSVNVEHTAVGLNPRPTFTRGILIIEGKVSILFRVIIVLVFFTQVGQERHRDFDVRFVRRTLARVTIKVAEIVSFTTYLISELECAYL